MAATRPESTAIRSRSGAAPVVSTVIREFTPLSLRSIPVLVEPAQPPHRVGLLICLIPPLGRQIHVVVCTVQQVDAALVARIGMKYPFVLVLVEHADPDHFADARLLLPVIPISGSSRHLFRRERHVEIIIEIGVE